MQCKIITGTKLNSEQQLQKILDNADEVISMDTSPNGTNGVHIIIIYIPKSRIKFDSDMTQL